MGQRSQRGRRGRNFSVRIVPGDRVVLEQLCSRDNGPRKLGPWLVWSALQRAPGDRSHIGHCPDVDAGGGTAGSSEAVPGDVPIAKRLILDLCAGSGSWSAPYKRAGYQVRRVTLPDLDVRTFVPPDETVWGVLCAPPCTEFSLAKNGQDRDFVEGLECVNACMRIVLTTRPRWWALENPVGLLGRWLGEPTDVFEPYQFGDPWSKRTALWGTFTRAARGSFVQPLDGGGPICEVCYPDNPRVCSIADHRAITPPGFAQAFFEANP